MSEWEKVEAYTENLLNMKYDDEVKTRIILTDRELKSLKKKVIENEKDILFIHQLIKVLFLENIAIVILLIIWSW